MDVRRAEKQVLAGWAHDLGKPLQVIGSHGRRLAQALSSDRQTRELALAIVALSDDALRVVDCLMESARPSESRVVRPGWLHTLLRRVVVVVRGLHPGCALWIRGPIPVLEIERSGQLFSVLVNLADNAVRASERCQAVTIAWMGGRIEIESIEANGTRATVILPHLPSDTGNRFLRQPFPAAPAAR